MKDLITRNYNRSFAFLALLLALVVTGGNSAFATDDAIQTAATTAISAAQTAGVAVLVAAIGVIASFILFKLVKRAANKV
jgi:hypothetical protein